MSLNNMSMDGDVAYVSMHTAQSEADRKTSVLDVCHLGWCRWRYVAVLVAVACVTVLVLQLVAMHERIHELQQWRRQPDHLFNIDVAESLEQLCRLHGITFDCGATPPPPY